MIRSFYLFPIVFSEHRFKLRFEISMLVASDILIPVSTKRRTMQKLRNPVAVFVSISSKRALIWSTVSVFIMVFGTVGRGNFENVFFSIYPLENIQLQNTFIARTSPWMEKGDNLPLFSFEMAGLFGHLTAVLRYRMYFSRSCCVTS